MCFFPPNHCLIQWNSSDGKLSDFLFSCQLHSQILDMKQEADTLREQISAERKSVKSLEELLQNNREKEFHSQLEFQERNAELKQLKDRLTLNESKL